MNQKTYDKLGGTCGSSNGFVEARE